MRYVEHLHAERETSVQHKTAHGTNTLFNFIIFPLRVYAKRAHSIMCANTICHNNYLNKTNSVSRFFFFLLINTNNIMQTQYIIIKLCAGGITWAADKLLYKSTRRNVLWIRTGRSSPATAKKLKKSRVFTINQWFFFSSCTLTWMKCIMRDY